MKKYFTTVLLLLGLIASFVACNKAWDAPEFTAPKYTGPAANKTIQDIINVYESAQKMDSICHYNDTFVVKAVVVSSDEGGNFYKSMVVQDETGAIQIQINKSGLFADYPVGQTVYIKCNGLVVGNYHGVYQIGWIYDGAIGRLDAHFLDQYLFKDGLPQKVTPVEINSAAGLSSNNVNRLVRIKNCEFADDAVGLPWSYDETVGSRAIKSINGTSVSNLIVRTSNYSKFRKMPVPSGKGDLVGILSVYNSTYQLMLRTMDDVETFGHLADVYSFDFTNGPSNWTVLGSWTHNTAWGMMVHGATSAAAEDWMVSPEINLASVSDADLYLEHRISTSDEYDFQNDYVVCYTTNYTGDPATTQWTQLTLASWSTTTETVRVQLQGIANVSSNFRLGVCYKAHGACTTQWGVKGLYFNKLVAN